MLAQFISINRLYAYCKGGKSLKRIITFFLSSTKIFEASKTEIVDPDQTAPTGAV